MWQHTDYKEIISFKLSQDTHRGSLTRYAKAMGCQPSFLSQVMNGSVHLTPDHAVSLAEHWCLQSIESEFFLHLVLIARSSTEKSRRFYSRKADELRDRMRTISSKIGKEKPSDEKSYLEFASKYYSSSYPVAVHIGASIVKYNSIESLADRLGLDNNTVANIVAYLVAAGYLANEAGKLKVLNSDVHLPGNSPFIWQHHQNWRIHATGKPNNQNPDTLRYTGVMAISHNAFVDIREQFLETLAKTRTLAAESKEEDLFCLNLDLYQI